MTARLPAALMLVGCVAALALAVGPARAQEDSGFMPKGGKTLLIDLLGQRPDPAEFRRIVTTKHSATEWQGDLPARAGSLADKELWTLAAYLAVNMPLSDAALRQAEQSEDIASALPRDGRELAWNECQYCHSLFTSHLTQDRDVQAWRNMFLSPFHRQMKVTAQEREEFATYSAINMPMKIEDVPADLRF